MDEIVKIVKIVKIGSSVKIPGQKIYTVEAAKNWQTVGSGVKHYICVFVYVRITLCTPKKGFFFPLPLPSFTPR